MNGTFFLFYEKLPQMKMLTETISAAQCFFILSVYDTDLYLHPLDILLLIENETLAFSFKSKSFFKCLKYKIVLKLVFRASNGILNQ